MELAKAAVTMSQDGYGGDKEYVVACKNRPFTVLMSNNFPNTKSSTSIQCIVKGMVVDNLHFKVSSEPSPILTY